jgi:tetratricopeptide (TPR) repeat protein
VYYYLGYFWDQKGVREKAMNYFQLAAQMPVDYCFPFRLESKIVLEQAMQLNPQDARAPFYLGNLLYDLQPEKAILAWERARSLDDRLALVHRNLGFAYSRVGGDTNKAIASLEKAVARDPDEPQYYAELDELYEKAGEPFQKRLALLEKNQTAVEKRGDALMREISLLIQTRHYDRAIQLLDSHHFRCWEGNERIAHNLYVDAHLQRGESLFQSKNYIEALKDFVSALEYPDRFELGKPSGGEDRTIEAEYYIGKTCEALGELAKARIHYQLAITPKLDWWSELSYFQGLAHQKLSQEIKARELFRGLVAFGRRGLESKKADEFYSKFGNAEQDTMRQARSHYLIGLGLKGEGKNAEATIEFQQVLKLNINHPGARSMLAMSAQ